MYTALATVPTNRLYEQEITLPLPVSFPLDFATLQRPIFVKARLVGPESAPVVLVLGGISADRHVCDLPNGKAGWWNTLVGERRILDTTRYRLLSFDFLPGNHDSHWQNPTKADPAGERALDYLPITTHDQARVANLLCEYLDIRQLHAFIGSSYGGMVALSFGLQFPQRVRHTVIIGAAHRPHPMGTAWRSIQRKIVRFGLETGQPDRALGLARELGMTTYRTSEEFGERFPVTTLHSPQTDSGVEKYLETRGQAFIGKMSPQRYLSLSHSIDSHQVEPCRIQTPVTLIGCRQDQLVPIEEIRQLHQELPQAAELIEFDSLYGHDSFLKETDILSKALIPVLEGPFQTSL